MEHPTVMSWLPSAVGCCAEIPRRDPFGRRQGEVFGNSVADSVGSCVPSRPWLGGASRL